MYNMNGILYRIFAVGLLLLLISILIFVLLRFEKSVKRKKIDFAIAIFALIFSLSYSSFFLYKFFNPLITYHEGYFLEEHRDSRAGGPLPFTDNYTFSSETGKSVVFYLDVFSKKDIYPKDFSINKRYRIYYEKDTNIIVRIEELE